MYSSQSKGGRMSFEWTKIIGENFSLQCKHVIDTWLAGLQTYKYSKDKTSILKFHFVIKGFRIRIKFLEHEAIYKKIVIRGYWKGCWILSYGLPSVTLSFLAGRFPRNTITFLVISCKIFINFKFCARDRQCIYIQFSSIQFLTAGTGTPGKCPKKDYRFIYGNKAHSW